MRSKSRDTCKLVLLLTNRVKINKVRCAIVKGLLAVAGIKSGTGCRNATEECFVRQRVWQVQQEC